MSVLTHSVKTLVSSTSIVQSFVVPNDNVELVLGQSARSVANNNFYLYQKQDFSKRRVAERVPMYLTASVYGKSKNKVRFNFDDSLKVSADLIKQVERTLVSHYQKLVNEKQASSLVIN